MVARLPEQQLDNVEHSATDSCECVSESRFNSSMVWLFSILVLAGTLYVSLAAEWPKFSRAEVFFAECAREMIAVHNWVTPLYHAHPFFDKPILMYWLVASSFTAFGASHPAARIPSIIAALLTVLIVGSWSQRMFGKRAGMIAAMALSSSFMFMSFAALCMSDMLLVFFDTLSMLLLYTGFRNEQRRTLLWWLASLCMALAFVTKGPVGVVLPVAAFGSFLLLSRNFSMVKLRHFVLALCTLVLVGVPWFLAAYQQNGSWALAYFFVRENFQRFAGSTYDTHKPIWFMVISLMAGFAPWSIVLPFALYRDVKRGKIFSARDLQLDGEQSEARNHKLFLWLWLAVVVGFFSLSRGKCDYYVLPAYPAASALVGMFVSEIIENISRRGNRIVIVRWLPTIVFVGICTGGIVFAYGVLPHIGQWLYTSRVCPLIKQTAIATRIGVFNRYSAGIDEITFQTAREPLRIDTTDQLRDFLKMSGPALAIVPEDEFVDLLDMREIRIAEKLTAISQPVTLGFIIKRKGMLADRVPVLLVANY